MRLLPSSRSSKAECQVRLQQLLRITTRLQLPCSMSMLPPLKSAQLCSRRAKGGRGTLDHRRRRLRGMFFVASLFIDYLTGSSDNAVVSRGVKAVNLISSMTARIPHLMKQSHLENSEGKCPSIYTHVFYTNSVAAWSAYWLPIFKALTTQCTNPCREVRSLAFSSLQRSLLSPELTCSDHKEWTAIFGEVLFPLILRLLKPEVYSSDRDGMSETRVQVASLLCKTFLQYLVLLSKWDGMLDLWLKIIDIMDRLMNSGQGDSLVSNCQQLSVPSLSILMQRLGGGCP